MEERTWRRGQKQTYTDRPLTEEERKFAEDWNNYKKLFEFMHFYRMNQEEWYDILIIPYLQAVKKYHVREDLRANYKFWHVCNLMLSKAVYNHNRAMNRQKRKPIGEILSLDYMSEGDNPFAEYTSKALEDYWIDQKQKVEKIVLDKEMLAEILIDLTEVQGKIFEMLLEGYSKKEIGKELSYNYSMLNAEINIIKNIIYRNIYGVA